MQIKQALQTAAAMGLERLDAQLLLLHALGRPLHERAWLLAHDMDVLSEAQQQQFAQRCQRRAAGEPLAYIVGVKEFHGLTLLVDSRVLIPRPDTETLVDWALELFDQAPSPQPSPASGRGSKARLSTKPILLPLPLAGEGWGEGNSHPKILDLGTGSGAIALALAHAIPHAQVQACDASPGALEVAQANAQRLNLRVEFTPSNWFSAVPGRFHLIVSNPPYIAQGDAHLAALTHEPASALCSGADGLDDIRHIIQDAPQHLHPGGWLLLEHGYDQAEKVRALLAQAGFTPVQSRHDLAGIERCSGGRWSGGLRG
jgi:release factor glutamine methyltransferase